MPDDKLVMSVTEDGRTGGLQLSISRLDAAGNGHGYRIAGPKFNGSGRVLLRAELAKADAQEIRGYLDAAFPQPPGALSESRRFQVSEARDILGTWDMANPGGISRETVLADQVRTLLAIIDQAHPAAQEVPDAR